MDAVSSGASAQELPWITQQVAARLRIGPRSPVPGATSMPPVTRTEREPGPCAVSVPWCCCWRGCLEEMSPEASQDVNPPQRVTPVAKHSAKSRLNVGRDVRHFCHLTWGPEAGEGMREEVCPCSAHAHFRGCSGCEQNCSGNRSVMAVVPGAS